MGLARSLRLSLVAFAMIAASAAFSADAPAGKPEADKAAAPVAAAPSAPSTEAAPGSPNPELEKSAKEWLVKLFEASQKTNGPDQKAARAQIEASLDWDQVARTCLGDAQWKKQAGKNRTEFRNLLKDVIVRTAFSRMDKFWNGSTYTWDKVTFEGKDKVILRAKFVLKDESYLLDYYLEKGKHGWHITDLAFEDLRYSVNINEQLSSFLKEKSFSQLLTNLKKRRDDLISGKKG